MAGETGQKWHLRGCWRQGAGAPCSAPFLQTGSLCRPVAVVLPRWVSFHGRPAELACIRALTLGCGLQGTGCRFSSELGGSAQRWGCCCFGRKGAGAWGGTWGGGQARGAHKGAEAGRESWSFRRSASGLVHGMWESQKSKAEHGRQTIRGCGPHREGLETHPESLPRLAGSPPVRRKLPASCLGVCRPQAGGAPGSLEHQQGELLGEGVLGVLGLQGPARAGPRPGCAGQRLLPGLGCRDPSRAQSGGRGLCPADTGWPSHPTPGMRLRWPWVRPRSPCPWP